MDMHHKVQTIVTSFENAFSLGDEDPYPSSFWHDKMIMLSDEELPLDMRVYCSWNEFKERRANGWILYSPYHLFRLPNEPIFVLGHRNKEWIVYDKDGNNIKKLKQGYQVLDTYDTFVDAIKVICS